MRTYFISFHLVVNNENIFHFISSRWSKLVVSINNKQKLSFCFGGLFTLFQLFHTPLKVRKLPSHQRNSKKGVCVDTPLILVVTSALTSADVTLTSGSRSPDETDGGAGSVTHSI